MNHLHIRPFKAVHPTASDAPKVASVPYDVVNREEATKIAREHVDSFMQVVRSEVNLPQDVSPYDPCVYEEAKKNYDSLRESGALTKDSA
jgi:uncharacterized protein (DUF1015 family)